jgi:RNA polymerase sigma-70 factor (TIGR02960 family)
VTEPLVARAGAGDEAAFRELTDPYRRELQVHCYRMLGSVQDAEDVVQETLLAAWRGLERFEGRASVRAWLYRIATNRCLNAARDAARRPRPAPPQPPFQPPDPSRVDEPTRLQPYPDAMLERLADTAPGPDARYEAREAIELTFIAAVQRLPPRQRATLVLRDVLGFTAAQVAEILDTSEAAIKSALQRGRAALEQLPPAQGRERAPQPGSPRERELVQRFADAFAADDIERVVALLTDDAWLTMPPSPLQYQGPAPVASFLQASADFRASRRFHLVPTRANTQPAFGLYVADERAPTSHPAGLVVLTLQGDRISAITRFLDDSILPRFGLPPTLDLR